MANEKRGKQAFFDIGRFSPGAVQNETQEVIASNNNPITTSNKNLQEDSLDMFVSTCGTQGKKGRKTPRMNLAIQEDVYEYIRRESRRHGLTYSEFICAVMRERQRFLGERV